MTTFPDTPSWGNMALLNLSSILLDILPTAHSHSHHPLWTLCYPLIQSPCPLSLLPIHSLHSNLHKTQRYKEFMKTCIAIIFTNFRVEVFILRIRSKGGGHLHSITDNY